MLISSVNIQVVGTSQSREWDWENMEMEGCCFIDRVLQHLDMLVWRINMRPVGREWANIINKSVFEKKSIDHDGRGGKSADICVHKRP